MFQSIQVKKSPTTDVRKSTQKDTDEVQVNVVLKSGHCINLPFGGFLHTNNSRKLQLVKVMDICALCSDEHATKVEYKIPNGHYIVGIYCNEKVFILIEKGIVRHELFVMKNSFNNNVIYLKNKEGHIKL
ncbi:hypothetical protein M2H05_09675 [Vibrio vulnificus]|nr:hypothetical protein [Vibrio vulnificus]ELX4137608.1 hypothetical protein [Vibrio vulnificus]MCU8218737.1 hypothetical protein [Vibrio vulnificus]